jgi:hypothetical protein
MPKIHNIGQKHFVQYIDFPVKWEGKLWVKGWTQEISAPFRTSEPLIFRMPFHKAFVVGTWTGKIDDEVDALNRAIQGRVLTDEDFSKDKGWVPAPSFADEAGREDWDL